MRGSDFAGLAALLQYAAKVSYSGTKPSVDTYLQEVFYLESIRVKGKATASNG